MTDATADPATIGPFVVLRKLGEGAMGVVYEGYDVKLERKVALKLVRRQLLNNPAVRERMNREAQAMARLSTPFVVQVYQVGEHDGGIYVAMEYVQGETLGAWLKSERRSWRVVLRTICDAGRGLAAAHAAGLVHRDFKPDNVLVDAEGRARVLDFGLVHTDGAPPPSDMIVPRPARNGNGDEELSATERGAEATIATQPGNGDIERSNLHWSRLTQIGKVAGTPAYMSLEQHLGQPAGPAADQFSFSVVLYEALYGMRPFHGDSWEAIRSQVQQGRISPPPLDSPVPRRLFKLITRGLATTPELRWPSLDLMIEALEHDPWRARVRVAGMAGLVGIASAASYSVAIAQIGAESCGVQDEWLAGVWDAAREAELARAFAATHAAFSTDAWKRVRGRLDAYAQAWTGERKAACEAHASGAQTGGMMDLRIACLGRRKAHLLALVDVFAAADAAVVENAVQAVAALPSIATCGDEEALLSQTAAPPNDPQTVVQVEEMRGQLARAAARETTGQYEEGLQLAAEARLWAGSVGYAPLEAEAALAEGRVLMNLGRPAEADVSLLRAVRLGIAHDMHAIAAEAAAIRIYVVGEFLGKRSDALATEPFAAALVERARDDGRLVALLFNNVGVVHHSGGAHERANEYYERSIEAQRQRPGAPDPLMAATQNNLGNLFLEQGRLDLARSSFKQSIDLFTSLLGDNHPLVSHALGGLGDVGIRDNKPFEALPIYTRALAVMEVSYGAGHRFLLYVLPGLGRAHLLAGQAAEARRHFERALEIAEAGAVESPEVAATLEGLADLAAAEGAQEQAGRLFARAAEMFDETAGADSEKGARAALRAGELAEALGDRDGALRWFERVLVKRPGSRGQSEARGAAALHLAVALAGRPDAAARVCSLLTEGRARLPASDPRRAGAEARLAGTCPEG